jgi:hypothetical protein
LKLKKKPKKETKKAKKPAKAKKEPEQEPAPAQAPAPEQAETPQEGGKKSSQKQSIDKLTFQKKVIRRRRRNEIAFETRRSQRRMK